jgi:hypothetical protein
LYRKELAPGNANFGNYKLLKKDKSVAKKDFPKLPSTIKPPTIEELKSMQAKLERLNKPLPKVYAEYYGEDWKTQGDWAVLFAVTSSGFYFVKIDRNYSFNTILSSVSVDRLHGEPTCEERLGIQCMCEMPYEPPPLPPHYDTGLGRQIGLLWKTLDEKYAVTGGIEKQRKRRIASYQATSGYSETSDDIKQLAKVIKWSLNQ